MSNRYEDECVEFKSVLNDKFEKEVVSFLNANGGHIFIGIDNDGKVCGVEDVDDTQLNIKNRIMGRIAPSAVGYFEIIVENRAGKDVIHVVIASGREKPYYLKAKGMCPEGSFIRIGSSCNPLTDQQIFMMFSKRSRTSLINIVSHVQDLTFRQLRIYYEENGYQFHENTLRQLQFYVDDKYNYLAYLLSDQNALVYNVGIFEGIDVVNLKEVNSFSNQSLIKTTEQIIDKIQSCNKTYTQITGSLRKEEYLFDSTAIREAVINAIVHNDYSYENVPTFRIFDDHLEIISVGGLPEGVEEKEFLSGYMSPKNPQLMKVFRDVKLVEHMGTGIIRILSKYDKSIYEFTTNFIKVSIPFKKAKENKTNIVKNIEIKKNRKELILDLLKDNDDLNQNELAELLSVSRYSIIRDFKDLEAEYKVERVGSKKSGKWKVK